MARVRLDQELVNQGYFTTVDEATRAIMAGEVMQDTVRLTKPGHQVRPGESFTISSRQKFVSRGGLKLLGALQDFSLDVHGVHALDIGASTGGFTDCLLQNGAAHVLAVDVGFGQFDWSLRHDKRVTLLERTNIIDVTKDDIDYPLNLVVGDVSFTSLETIIPHVMRLTSEGTTYLLLIKPQFEARKEELVTGGVITDPQLHRVILKRTTDALSDLGLNLTGITPSKLKGPKGNREFFVRGVQGSKGKLKKEAISAVVESAWKEI